MPAFIQSFAEISGRGYQTLRTMLVIAVQAARRQQLVENRQLENGAQKSHGRLLTVYKGIIRFFWQNANMNAEFQVEKRSGPILLRGSARAPPAVV
jgi:hypothetical protein